MNFSNITTKICILSNDSVVGNDSCQRKNETAEFGKNYSHFDEKLKPIVDFLLLTLLIVILLSIGCAISWSQLKAHIKNPIGIGIGSVCQFFIIPLTAYTLMRNSAVSGLYATEILIIACCPGGVLSNAFTYFYDGDLSLSVAMTSVSTLLSMGMMPLNLWIYGHSFDTEGLVIPYGNLSLHLISMAMLVTIGMLLRWKFPTVAKLITKVGRYIGHLIVITCIILEGILLPDMFAAVPGHLYSVTLGLPLLGLSLGYILAFSFKQDVAVRKTIAIECGIQNVPIAITIISYSFRSEQLKRNIILLPWLYAFSMMSGYTVLCMIYQMHKQYMSQKTKKEKGFDLDFPGN